MLNADPKTPSDITVADSVFGSSHDPYYAFSGEPLRLCSDDMNTMEKDLCTSQRRAASQAEGPSDIGS
jgi:hypothetical protein